MSKRIINLYTHLIQNRKHQLIGWYEDYKRFCKDVETIRINLGTTNLKDKATYNGTSFAKADKPFDDFVCKLLYEQSNGVSSRGQSVLSSENLNKFKQAQGFVEIPEQIKSRN